jgi:ASCH domain
MSADGASDDGPADEARATDDRERIALAIQQPWAELILRGIKTLEIRSQPTRQRGTILLYASKRVSALPAAHAAVRRLDLDIESLPRGKVVGSVDLIDCRLARSSDQPAACVGAELLKGQFAYEVVRPRRFATPRAPRFLPYGVWFYPFKRRPKRDR